MTSALGKSILPAASAAPVAPAHSYAELRNPIFSGIVAPDFARNVNDLVVWRFKWQKIADATDAVGQALMCLIIILTFAASFFDMKLLSFISGCAAATCLALGRYSAYANGKSLAQTASYNRLLGFVGIDPAPAVNAGPPANEGPLDGFGGRVGGADAAGAAASGAAAAAVDAGSVADIAGAAVNAALGAAAAPADVLIAMANLRPAGSASATAAPAVAAPAAPAATPAATPARSIQARTD
jgi:hypothetical protein